MFLTAVIATAAIELTTLPTQAEEHWVGASAPSANVIWLGSTTGTIARSTDAGATWQYVKPANDQLQFRDIEALDANHAYALSIGDNGNSRIYYTANGGTSWTLRFRAGSNQFLNCIDVSSRNEAWVYGDSLENHWDMVRSADGRNWMTARNTVDSQPLPDEGGLAASGGCVRFNHDTWAIGTANADTARLLVKRSRGIRFKAIDTPMPAGPGAGIASVWPLAEDDVILAGGDLNNTDTAPRLMRYQSGEFSLLPEPELKGALYSLTVIERADRAGDMLVSNPNGAAYFDAVNSKWLPLTDANVWNSVCSSSYCYLVGKNGFVARFTLDNLTLNQ